RLGGLPLHAVRLELEHKRRAAAAVPDLGLLARQLAGCARGGYRALGLDQVRAAATCAALGVLPRTALALDARLRRRVPPGEPGGLLDPRARRPSTRGRARVLEAHHLLAGRPRVAVLDLGLAPVSRRPARPPRPPARAR